MRTRITIRHVVAAVLLAVVGAGCPQMMIVQGAKTAGPGAVNKNKEHESRQSGENERGQVNIEHRNLHFLPRCRQQPSGLDSRRFAA